MNNKNIAIDARMYGLKHAGIGRYVSNLLKNFPAAKYTLIVRKKDLKEIKKELGTKFKYLITEGRHYSIKEQLLLPRLLNKKDFDLVHFPHFNVPIFFKNDFVVTIHDLIKHKSKGPKTTTRFLLFYWIKFLIYKLVFKTTIFNAKQIIVPSKWVKKELERFYPKLKTSKVNVVYEGVESKFFSKIHQNEKNKILEKHNIQKPYLLYVGSVYPHKNIDRLIKALKIYEKKGKINLLIIGSRNVFLKRLETKLIKLKAKDFVIHPGFVADNELSALYQEAEAFVTPSLMEGFGLPGLEAMAAGCPVLASDASCFTEVYSDAAMYFDPLDIYDIEEKIDKLLSNKELKKGLINKGKKRAKKFSWEKCARKTMEVYENSFGI